MKKQIEANEHITSNSKQIAVLKQHFPNCFDKDGKFMPDKMNEIVQSDGADISREGYSLNWLGKSYARLLANLETETLLAANSEHNAKAENENSENMLIQGDNLDVLKHLKNAYAEKVKMIYIDPPYNTGGDGFVYADDRKFSVDQLSQLAGIDEDEAKRILEFTQSKSNSHSAWLTFMYPRLYVAKELLRDDGVIFISIDDNEQAQLKMLCDEIFGEENFLAKILWEKVHTRKNSSKEFSTSHEYLFCYGKIKQVWDRVLLPREGKSAYSNPDNHPKGPWKADPITAHNEYSADYKITKPNGVVLSRPIGGYWRFSEKTIGDKTADNAIIWGEGDSYPMIKRFLSEVQDGLVPVTLWDRKFAGDTSSSKKEIDGLLGQQGLFEYTKPTLLIKRAMQISTRPNDIILDFFSGSGSTAHAVMALNAQDGGNRRHISVQLDEATDPKSEAHKAGYKTIYDITRERILRAAAKLQEEYPEAQCDFGFKEYKTIPAFDGYLNEADTIAQYEAFDGKSLSDKQRAQLRLTWQVYDGLPLSMELEPIDLQPDDGDAYTAHQGDHILYFMDNGLSLAHIIKMLERIDSDKDFAPQKLVMFESIFTDKSKREIAEAINGYNNRKGLELNLEVRY